MKLTNIFVILRCILSCILLLGILYLIWPVIILCIIGIVLTRFNKISKYIKHVNNGQWISVTSMLPEDYHTLTKNDKTDKVIVRMIENNNVQNNVKIIESARAFNLYYNKWEWLMPTYDKKTIAINKYKITHWMRISNV